MPADGDMDALFVRRELPLAGPLVLTPRRRQDGRGWLAKLFHSGAFAEVGLPAELHELFVTSSGARVIRGLHFQAPPAAQAKYVTCLTGAVMDVVLDIRNGSPTYGRHCALTLDADVGDVVYVPEGFAHGFAVVSGPAVMLYAVTHVWEPSCDAGVRWDSAGVAWPFADPLISERDAGLTHFDQFGSPFVAGEESAS